jgi:hypothetical protein
MKSSFGSLIPFLPLFCSSIQSSYPGRLEFRTSTLPDCFSLLRRVLWLCPFITPRHEPHGKHSLYYWRGVFTALLPSNIRPIVAHVGSSGNVFTESLPNSGSTRHNIFWDLKPCSLVGIHKISGKNTALFSVESGGSRLYRNILENLPYYKQRNLEESSLQGSVRHVVKVEISYGLVLNFRYM